MDLKVTFKLDTTDAFRECVMAIAAVVELAAKREGRLQEAEAVKPAEVPAKPVQVKKEEEVPAEAPATETAAEPAKAPSVLDVRTAMDLCRKRIEGNDYAENTSGEGYKKYHKKLTQEFKNIAALLGSDKPSTLAEEARASFIEQVGQLDILEDGTIGKPLPF